MKTKTIPFDLETAKKIQAGEIKGSIKTRNGLTCKIVSYCDGSDFFVERTTEVNTFRWCYPYTKDGRYIDGKNNGGTDYDLVLEISDDKPEEQHPIEESELYQAGYKVGFEAGRCVAFDEKKGCAIKETPKHEFKPFEQVLVREEWVWVPRLYGYSEHTHLSDRDETFHIMTNGKTYLECIPFKGNENLVGTTNNPKEE